MKHQHLVLSALLLAMNLAGCTGNEPSSQESSSSVPDNPSSTIVSSAAGKTEQESFERIINDVLTHHNYTLSVRSYIDAAPTEIYEDDFYNINDTAYYNRFYNSYSGIIQQGDQGYVSYVESNGVISTIEFISTNPNKGVSAIYPWVIENVLTAPYTQSETNANEFITRDQNAITISSKFTGYSSSSWMIEPEFVKAVLDGERIIFFADFQVAYIDYDTGEGTFSDGHCTMTLQHIGTTSNAVVDAYVLNPTDSYVAPTEWSNDFQEKFNNYYFGYLPPFLENASYAISLDREDVSDGVDLLLTDYECGDQSFHYARLLMGEGYVADENNPKLYRRTVVNQGQKQTITYTAEISFAEPGRAYQLGTIGDYFPAGIFQVLYSARAKNSDITSVAALNEYMQANNINRLVPLLPFGDTCTRIANFSDRTSNMNQLVGEGSNLYIFYTSTWPYIRLYFNSQLEAKTALDQYQTLLVQAGFDDVVTEGAFTQTTNTTWNESYNSYVIFSNVDYITDWKGYVEMRFNIYTPDNDIPGGDDPSALPPIKVKLVDHLKSYRITDAAGNSIKAYDPTIDDGYFYVTITPEEGYEIESVVLSGDENALISYDATLGKYVIKPSSSSLASYEIVATIISGGPYLSYVKNLTGGSISLINPANPGYIAAGTNVSFSITVREGYQIDQIYIVEDNAIVIIEDDATNHVYSFIMPDAHATIMVTFTGSSPAARSLSQITVNATKTTYNVGEAFAFVGQVYAIYSDGTTADVTSSPDLHFYGYNMNVAGTQTVQVTYEENYEIRYASYTIVVQANSSSSQSSVDPSGDSFVGKYALTKRMAGYDTELAFTFNADHTGYYTRNPNATGQVSTIYFTWSKTGNSLRLVYVAEGSGYWNDFGGYRPFNDNEVNPVNETGVVIDEASISITVYNSGGKSPQTLTFTKTA